MYIQYMMIRPEISEEIVNKVKILSGNTLSTFQESLEILISKYELLLRRKKI